MNLFMLCMDFSKYYICHILQLQHSSYLVGFSYHTFSKFNFLMNIFAFLINYLILLSSLCPIVVLNLTHSSYLFPYFVHVACSQMRTTDTFIWCMDLLSCVLLDKYICYYLLQLQHSSLPVGF